MCGKSLCVIFILGREKNPTISAMWPDRNHIVHDWKALRNRCSVKIIILFPHFTVKWKGKIHCCFENTGFLEKQNKTKNFSYEKFSPPLLSLPSLVWFTWEKSGTKNTLPEISLWMAPWKATGRNQSLTSSEKHPSS